MFRDILLLFCSSISLKTCATPQSAISNHPHATPRNLWRIPASRECAVYRTIATEREGWIMNRSCNQSASTFATWSSGARFCARSPAAAAAVLQSGRAAGSGGCSIVFYAPDFYARSQRPPTRGGAFYGRMHPHVSPLCIITTRWCVLHAAVSNFCRHISRWKKRIEKNLAAMCRPLSIIVFCLPDAFMYFIPDLQSGKHLIVQLTTHIIWWSWATSHSVYWSHVGRPRLQRKLRFGGNSHVQKYEELSFPLYEILTKNGLAVILQSVRK